MERCVPWLSVVICTRNRASRLRECLDHLSASGRAAGATWELVVVDNGSTDDTRSVVEDWAKGGVCPLTVVFEPRRGLAAARNAGVRAGRGEVLAFVDDDCLVDRSWMAAVVDAHRTESPPDLVGGRVDLRDARDAPVAVRRFDDRLDIGNFEQVLGRLIGCNFSVRTEALQAVGPFDERLGAGTRSRSAEDLDLFYRMLRAGRRLRYDPDVRLDHAHGRRTADELATLARGYLRGRGAFFAKHIVRGDAALLRPFYWELRSAPNGVAARELLLGAVARLLGG